MRRKCMWEKLVREWLEEERQRWKKCYLHVFPKYEPVLCMCFFVCPLPQQHGQAPNQALLQPQHLCAGQTVSGAAQVADVPSHERGSRNARQEAQCAWERQLCKLRRDVWQHLTAPHHHPSAPLLPLLHLFLLLSSSSSPPSFPPLLFLGWQVHVDFTCLINMRIWPLIATNFSVPFLLVFFFGREWFVPIISDNQTQFSQM